VEGTVASEADAPWVDRVPGTRPATVVLGLVGVVVFLAAGGAALLVNLALSALCALMPLVVVVFVVLFLLPDRVSRTSGRLLSPLRFFPGPRRAPRVRASVVPGGRLVSLSLASGRMEELVVAGQHRFPAGQTVRAWGPRVGGRRYVWLARRSGFGGVVVGRGLLRLVVLLALVVLLGLAAVSS
jgi:hypothetical protein